MQPNDEALVLACRRGDAAAWEALSARYRQLVYMICRRAGLDREQAADACQNVFAILARKIDQLEQPERLGAWLVTTARRQAFSLRERERSVAGSLEDEREVDMIVDDAPLPDDQVLLLEEQLKVRAAVAALDERCQQLLTLLFYRPDPAPYAEITAALGIAQGSIGPLRGRCLDRLRRKLEELDF